MDYSVEQRLICITKADAHYQQLLHALQSTTETYTRILQSLSAENQEALENYISLYEELEYRRTCLAYCLDTRDGVLQGYISCLDG